jgi:putative DNA primase/helicase
MMRMDWLKIGAALSKLDDKAGYSLFKTWSKQSYKYDDDQFDEHWSQCLSFTKISIASLFYAANKAGWAIPPLHIQLPAPALVDYDVPAMVATPPASDAADAEMKQRHINEAKEIWSRCHKDAETVRAHDYCKTKQLSPCAGAAGKLGMNLVVPVYDLAAGNGTPLCGVQLIGGMLSGTDRRFKRNVGKFKHAIAVIPNMEAIRSAKVVLVAEGFATGQTLHEATGLPVVITNGAANLADDMLASYLVDSTIANAFIICADGDEAGRTAALAMQATLGVLGDGIDLRNVIITAPAGTDFNDAGVVAVRTLFNRMMDVDTFFGVKVFSE